MNNLKWYVLRSKPHKEKVLFKYASSLGYSLFHPTIPVNPVNPRAAKIRSYFPGYMFLHADLMQMGESAFQWMPFSQGIVRTGNEPAAVPETIIHRLQQRVEEIWQAGGIKLDRFKKGENLLIREGLFEGYRAIFDVRIPGSERVRVLLEMLSDRYIPMELDVGYLEKANY